MMPMRVIGMLLGIPESEQISVRDANDANLRTKPGAPLKVANADSIADGRIYADYVEWRSKNPSDDLMTTLLNVEFDDEHGVHRKLTRKEVLHYTQVVAGAGNETTGRLIGWLAKVLAEHPDQRREIEQDRSLLNRTVDETLRFEPTGPHVARWMAEDFDCYGTTIPAGSAMLLLFGAANRDPRRYTDPDNFNIHATTSRTSPSAKACTTAWAPTSPAWRAASRWTRSSTAGPSGTSTTTQHNSRRRRRSAVGSSCGSCCPKGSDELFGCGISNWSRNRCTKANGLVVTAGGAEPLLEDQGAADRGDDDREGGRRKIVGVEVVFADDEVQRGDLLLAPALGPGRDLRRISLRWLASPMNSNSSRVSLGAVRVSQKACSGRSEASAFCWRSR